jgi:hypothetical protein
MKRIVLVSIALLAIATSVFAQAGAVMLWGDAGFTTCNVVNPVGLATVYMTHEGHPGATAIQFALSDDTGVLAWVADQNQFPLALGNTQTGYATTYGGCVAGQIHIVNVLYTVAGAPAACTGITVVPDPAALTGEIEAVNCSQVKVFPNASFLSFNEDGSCVCGEITPVEESSWGRVKALYQ